MDKVFSDVKFVIAECNNSEAVRNILIEEGAKHINYLSEHVTLVVADAKCPEADEAVELFDKPVVNSRWVLLSLKARKLLPTEAFSPIRNIFHHVVASFSSDLSKNDVEILAATLTFHGARVIKNVARSTHFIVANANPSDVPDESSHLKIVAPDWILESVKQNSCCDEKLFDPSLLLPPKPPTPSPPPPPPPQPPQTEGPKSQPEESASDARKEEQQIKIEQTPQHMHMHMQHQHQPQATCSQSQVHQQQHQQKPHPQMQSHHPNHLHQQMQTLPSQLPRPRMQANITRGIQHKFRPILPPNNVPLQPRSMVQPSRVMTPDSNQGRKMTINIDHRKPNPYQNNLDSQQIVPLHQQHPYTQTHVPVPSQQSQSPVGITAPNNRHPQPNIYHQVRPAFQNSHMQPRNPTHQTMLNQQQHHQAQSQQQHQLQPQQQPPTQMINRFQDPSMHHNQRPYQVNLQPQPVNPNYQSGNMHRQQIYYTQSSNQIQMRMPQQPSPGIRHPQNEQTIVYDNFSPSPLIQSPIQHPQHLHTHEVSQQQPHYQVPPQQQQTFHHQQHSQPPVSQPQVQPQQPQQSQPSQHLQISQPSLISPPRPQNPQKSPGLAQGTYQVRPARVLFNNQQELRAANVRPPRMASQPIRGPVMPAQSQLQQPQPHPSIFDPAQESNLAQIKAKVPIVTETFNYYGHDPKENVPKDLPLHSCTFKIIDYENIHPSFKVKWCSAIKAAGGTITENLQDVTILICENRLSPLYSEAIKMGVRCVTIYWLNDVLAQKHLSYPWKALHMPLPFSKADRPLVNHTITITNFKNKERREVKDMIIKTGAKYTDYFSVNNSLIICGSVGGEKYDRAIEWKIPIANCRILSDILLSENNRSLDVMLAQKKYQLFNRGDQLKLTTYADVKVLMSSWTKPIAVAEKKESEPSANLINGAAKNLDSALNSNGDSGFATSGSTNNDLETSTNIKLEVTTDPAMKEAKCQVASDDINKPLENGSDRAIVQAKKKLRNTDEPVRILFTHLEQPLVDQLTKYATELGLGYANGPVNCTHLIVDRISRTPKFICAFSHAKHILSYKWLVESHEAKNLLDESLFNLQDEIGESKFSLKLAYSLMKRKKYGRLLFDGFVFFVSPSVVAEVSSLKEMIESAGATMITRKLPSKLQLIAMKVEKKRFVVVTCDQDLHLCSALDVTIPRVGVEFILSGILRQDIDFEAHRISDETSRKKVRLEE